VSAPLPAIIELPSLVQRFADLKTRAEANAVIDALELEMSKFPAVDCPLAHEFLPGFYVRSILMPAGAIVTSRVHATRHPYHVAHGRLTVVSWPRGTETIEGPHWGMTEPGTRRVLFVEEETLWTTMHATNLTDVEAIEDEILIPYINPLLPWHTSPSLSV
jgi:hypothetical protein